MLFFNKRKNNTTDNKSIKKAFRDLFISDKYKTYDLNFDIFRDDVLHCPPVTACWNEITSAFKNLNFGVYKKINGSLISVRNDFVDRTLSKPNDLVNYSNFLENSIFNKLFGGVQLIEKKKGIYDAKLIQYSSSKISSVIYSDDFKVKEIHLSSGTIIEGKTLDNFFIQTNSDPLADICGMTAGYTHYKALGQLSDLLNFILKHNISLTRNSGHANGLLSPKPIENQRLEGKAFDKLKSKIEDAIGNFKRAGKRLILPIPMDYIDLERASKDLDWVNGYELGKRLIAGVMGVPLPLVSTQASTYNNVKEARKSFNRNTIIPLAREQADYFTMIFKENLKQNEFIYFDKLSILDLKDDTDAIINTLAKADFLTIREKRQLFCSDTGRSLEEIKSEVLDQVLVSTSTMLADDLLDTETQKDTEE